MIFSFKCGLNCVLEIILYHFGVFFVVGLLFFCVLEFLVYVVGIIEPYF